MFMCRCLGDTNFKIPTSESNFVSCEPYFNSLQIVDDYKFILLACDGLFDKVEPQKAMEFLHNHLENNNNDVKGACDALADFALSAGSTDNITIVLIKFNWS
jgi:serine/threonine protein phosphatase PrpC